MNKVSFDFDQTLSRSYVQEFAKDLIAQDVEVWVHTARPVYEGIKTHFDLFKVTDSLKIPREKVVFCNYVDKAEFLDNTFKWHLDDDELELIAINNNLLTIGIQVQSPIWQQKCLKYLEEL